MKVALEIIKISSIENKDIRIIGHDDPEKIIKEEAEENQKRLESI
nr:hypothetical protein [uncultured Bacillus sp.]